MGTYKGDFDKGGDLDMTDLAIFAADDRGSISVEEFAEDFGGMSCL